MNNDELLNAISGLVSAEILITNGNI